MGCDSHLPTILRTFKKYSKSRSLCIFSNVRSWTQVVEQNKNAGQHRLEQDGSVSPVSLADAGYVTASIQLKPPPRAATPPWQRPNWAWGRVSHTLGELCTRCAIKCNLIIFPNLMWAHACPPGGQDAGPSPGAARSLPTSRQPRGWAQGPGPPGGMHAPT